MMVTAVLGTEEVGCFGSCGWRFRWRVRGSFSGRMTVCTTRTGDGNTYLASFFRSLR
jgi:hypothetical protein